MNRFKSYKIIPERREIKNTKEWEQLLSGKSLSNKKTDNSLIWIMILIGIGITILFMNEDFVINLYHNLSKNEMKNNLAIQNIKDKDNLPIEVKNNNKVINFNSEPAVITNFILDLNRMEIDEIIDNENDKVSIYLDLKNISNNTKHINYMNFEVYDKFKNKMDYDIKNCSENLLDNNLEAGEEISGKITFKITNKINEFYLVFKDTNPQNRYIYFTLPRNI